MISKREVLFFFAMLSVVSISIGITADLFLSYAAYNHNSSHFLSREANRGLVQELLQGKPFFSTWAVLKQYSAILILFVFIFYIDRTHYKQVKKPIKNKWIRFITKATYYFYMIFVPLFLFTYTWLHIRGGLSWFP